MKVYSYTRGWEDKHPYLTQRTEFMRSTDYYVGGNMDPHTRMPKQKPHVLAIKEKLFSKGEYMDKDTAKAINEALGLPNTDAGRYIPGYLDHYTRVPSPPHVMRWRYEILGTGQETPVYSYIEIVADVNGSRPKLP